MEVSPRVSRYSYTHVYGFRNSDHSVRAWRALRSPPRGKRTHETHFYKKLSRLIYQKGFLQFIAFHGAHLRSRSYLLGRRGGNISCRKGSTRYYLNIQCVVAIQRQLPLGPCKVNLLSTTRAKPLIRELQFWRTST